VGIHSSIEAGGDYCTLSAWDGAMGQEETRLSLMKLYPLYYKICILAPTIVVNNRRRNATMIN
jgi:hypothetical protein